MWRWSIVLPMAAMVLGASGLAAGPDTLWIGTYEGLDYANSIVANSATETSDGRIAVAVGCLVEQNDLPVGATIMMLDGNGNLLWTDYNPVDEYRTGQAVFEREEGGFLVFGNVNDFVINGTGMMMHLVDSSGYPGWLRTYFYNPNPIVPEDKQNSYLNRVKRTPDGNFVVCGYVRVQPEDYISRPAVLKINTSGDTLWSWMWLGNTSGALQDVIPLREGGYIAVGSMAIQEGVDWPLRHVFLVRFTEEGEVVWTHTYTSFGYGSGMSVAETPDGGFMIAGHAQNSSSGAVTHLIRTNGNGSVLWSRSAPQSDLVRLMDLEALENGYIAAGGLGWYQASLLRFNENGDTVWTRPYWRNDQLMEYFTDVEVLADGGYAAVGFTFKFGETEPFVYVVRTLPDTARIASVEEPLVAVPCNPSLCVCPNPFNSETRLAFELPQVGRVTLRVFDVQGRRVSDLLDDVLPSGPHAVRLDASPLPTGVYFACLQAGDFSVTEKLLLLR